jgi:hypothetical protein
MNVQNIMPYRIEDGVLILPSALIIPHLLKF